MSKILGVFGIDWRLLVVNAINFGLLLFLLKYYAYGPIMNALEARRQKVSEGVRNADLAERRLKSIEASKAEILAQAGKEADALLAHGREAGIAKEKEIIAEGEMAAVSLLKDAENQAKEMKAQAIAESREEVAKLIVLGMEKGMGNKN
ncbi:MAG TPA: F0F1 ATP synthase subunit B [Candidatus Paceibacterota bacterium]|nr:F0F1 ATP synthase subunit B [Candidatus Paceibacterota bacterium]